MTTDKISLFWKKLENALAELEKSTQLWLLEKFLEEANSSIKGVFIFSFIIFENCINLLLIASKMVPKEPEIMKIKTLQNIKNDKTKSKKKILKKKQKSGKGREARLENNKILTGTIKRM